MSLEQHAFIAREKVPSVAEWQAAISELGFDLQLYPELKPFEHSGGAPCKLGSLESGFEIYYDRAEELFDTYPHAREPAAHRDYAISLRYFGDTVEFACVCIALAALAKSFDVVLYDPQEDMVYTFDDIMSDARQALAEIEKERAPQKAPKWQKLVKDHLLPQLPGFALARGWLFRTPIGWQVSGFLFQRSGQSFTIEAGVVPLYAPQSLGLTFTNRLGIIARKGGDKWWDLDQQDAPAIFADVLRCIRRDGLPYLARRATVEAMTRTRRHQVTCGSDERYEHQAILCAGILLDDVSVVEREWQRFTSYHEKYLTPETREWEVQLHEATQRIYRLYHDDPTAAREEIARWRIARAEELGLAKFLADEPTDLRGAARRRWWPFGPR
jgi:hypothetical protein